MLKDMSRLGDGDGPAGGIVADIGKCATVPTASLSAQHRLAAIS